MFAPAVTAMYIESQGVSHSSEVVRQVDGMVDIMKAAFETRLLRASTVMMTWSIHKSMMKEKGFKITVVPARQTSETAMTIGRNEKWKTVCGSNMTTIMTKTPLWYQHWSRKCNGIYVNRYSLAN